MLCINRRNLMVAAVGMFRASAVEASSLPPRFGIADVSNDISVDLKNAQTRFSMFHDLGFDMIRTAVGWSGFEGRKNQWALNPARLKYFELAARSGLKLKLEIGAWSSVPDWFLEENPDAKLLNASGQYPRTFISPWYPELAQLLAEKQSRIISDLNGLGLFENTGAVIASLGPAGEPIYPAAWEMHGAKEDTFWFYGELPNASFRKYAMSKHGGNLQSANRQWATAFTQWLDVDVPRPGTVHGPFWGEVLAWYRDSKRIAVAATLKNLNANLKSHPSSRSLPVIALLPGSHIPPSELQRAIISGDGSGAIKIMTDTEYLTELAGKEQVSIQYTASQDQSEVAYISAFIKDKGIHTSLWLENAGGRPSRSPAQLADVFVANKCYGFDYINAHEIIADGGGLNTDLTQKLKLAVSKMKASVLT